MPARTRSPFYVAVSNDIENNSAFLHQDRLPSKPVSKSLIANPPTHFAIAIRAQMLLFAFNSPSVMFLIKTYATNITAPWFKNRTENDKYNKPTN